MITAEDVREYENQERENLRREIENRWEKICAEIHAIVMASHPVLTRGKNG